MIDSDKGNSSPGNKVVGTAASLWRARLSKFLGSAWGDVLLLVLLVVPAFRHLRVTPQFAANLPQDASDFAIPAINFLEHGKFALSAFGQMYEMGHPFGLPLLLVPCYAIFGHFPGNGIHFILLCALATVGLVYFVGKQLGGRVCGLLAALFLIVHHGFDVYTRKIMTEVPSMFLLTLVFVLVLRVMQREKSRWEYLAIGAVAGLTIAVRHDNILVLVPLLGLAACRLLNVAPRRILLLGAGFLPWVVALASYNQSHYGSPWRTGIHYMGNAGTKDLPLFSTKNITTLSYIQARNLPTNAAGLVEGNLSRYSKTLLNQADITMGFANAVFWSGRPRMVYEAVAVERAILGLLGLGLCVWLWRKGNRLAGALFVWSFSLSLVMLVFYSLYFWQEERFLLRLAPFLCLLNAVGGAALLKRPRPGAHFFRFVLMGGGIILIAQLIASLAYLSATDRLPGTDDNLLLYATMQMGDRNMESNAVVITDFDPFRADAFLIRGTQRTCVQLGPDEAYYYQPVTDQPKRPVNPYFAVQEPQRIGSFMQSGRPAYLFLHDILADRQSPETVQLSQQFQLHPLLSLGVKDRTIVPFLYQIIPKQVPPQN